MVTTNAQMHVSHLFCGVLNNPLKTKVEQDSIYSTCEQLFAEVKTMSIQNYFQYGPAQSSYVIDRECDNDDTSVNSMYASYTSICMLYKFWI